ncbi:NAD-dependent epimerase/dehydratase family protein [Curtobacterium flaccumfaciens]|nr:NAD-dependent epimerase/dehydratase family protein [Curtobacterium flaccumfaciens]
MSTRRAVVLGGTGGIGSAVARELLNASGRGGDDWQVDVVARRGGPAADDLTEAGATFVPGDRRDAAVLRELLRPGADLLVDTVGLTRDDALQLRPFLDDVGSTVFVSSKAVYVDEQGRHANSAEKPVFGGAVTELQPTVAASDGDPTSRDGYGAAKVAAEQVLLDHGAPVTVFRPSKVYGVGIGRPREWFVVRRVLDGRERILLADHGRGVDHTTAASGIASLVRLVADAADRRILNVADDTAPSVLEIVQTIAGHLDHHFDEVLLDADSPRSSVSPRGRRRRPSPSTPRPPAHSDGSRPPSRPPSGRNSTGSSRRRTPSPPTETFPGRRTCSGTGSSTTARRTRRSPCSR